MALFCSDTDSPLYEVFTSSSTPNFTSGFHMYMSPWSGDLPSSRLWAIVPTTVGSALAFLHNHIRLYLWGFVLQHLWPCYLKTTAIGGGGSRFSKSIHGVRTAKRKHLWIIYRHYILQRSFFWKYPINLYPKLLMCCFQVCGIMQDCLYSFD